MSEQEQPTIDPYEASGEPSLRPEDYDFAVAGTAESLKGKLDTAEEVKAPLEAVALENIAKSALGSREDEGESPFQAGYDNQSDLKQASKKVDDAFDAAKKHYRENEDQYVEIAAQEYNVVKEEEKRQKEIDDIPF